MDEKKTNFALLMITLAGVLGLGVNEIFLGDGSMIDDLNDYYVCIINDDVYADIMEFQGGTSKSGYTGYPYSDSRSGYTRCINSNDERGAYVQIGDYAEQLGVSVYDLISDSQKSDASYSSSKDGWICYPPPRACEKIGEGQ